MQETKPLSSNIQQVLHEFARERCESLEPSERHAYRGVLFFLELCVNSYGHRNLEDPERGRYELRRQDGDDVPLRRDVRSAMAPFRSWASSSNATYAATCSRARASSRRLSTSSRTSRRGWWSTAMSTHRTSTRPKEAARARLELRRLARRATRLLSAWTVTVDPSFFARSDYLEVRDVPITRVAPGRIWLRVYRSSRAELVGPLSASIAATRSLRTGFCLNGSIARIRGRWHLTGVDSVYPRAPREPVCARRRRG